MENIDENGKRRSSRRRAKEEDAQKEKIGFVGKIVFRTIVSLLALGILGCAALFGGRAIFKVSKTQKHTRVQQELVYCAELVSVKMRYSEIVSLKRSGVGGLARSYSIVRFTGVINAGIADISQASVTIGDEEDSGKITVILPKPEILGNDIASQEVYDEQQSIFRSLRITTDDIFGGIDAARAEAEKNIVASGVLDDAGRHACAVVRSFLRAAGFENVVVLIEENGRSEAAVSGYGKNARPSLIKLFLGKT